MATIPSEAEVLGWMQSLSNWGRWGDDDQLGCMNLITPEKRKQAASLIQASTTERGSRRTCWRRCPRRTIG